MKVGVYQWKNVKNTFLKILLYILTFCVKIFPRETIPRDRMNLLQNLEVTLPCLGNRQYLGLTISELFLDVTVKMRYK